MRFITLIFSLFSFYANAANYKGIEYTLEPVYGYQKVKLTDPYERTAYVHFYGARISGGYKIFNLEGMYMKTETDDLQLNSNLLIRDIIEKLSVGFSTSKELNNWSLALLRIGAEGTRIENHSISGSTKTITKPKDEIFPYLGIGFEIYLKSYAAISIGTTVVFKGLPDSFSDNEYNFNSGIKFLY